ncbi:Short-chain dehydrogenase/reductase SDR [Lasiodiplodia theobromae]|uniref:Levodione reductase n=2 Tax=Lasiodiplodia TaxID=66739 RepID=A0A5N5DPV0_9PEZI|nr:Levodione reductase [Lasiodiplodia theobromae]KAF9631595.1 Short-chain dehydrogenase/reductase SDR [Lasiodiplodia theobromae]KAK0662864.1 Levodione reductase [Lasiodiplodia hormozganensis]
MAEVTPTPIRDRFLNKVCFITGGGGAIGLCTAIRFVNEGARVVLVDVSPETLAAAEERIAAALPSSVQLQDRLLSLQADVTSEADVAKTFEETLRKWGRLDCAFLNVGVSYAGKSLFDTSEEEYDRVMRINVKSAFLTLKHAASAMKEQTPSGGSIILTSSIAGLRGTPGLSVYSTSKFAIRGLGQSAAAELGQYGIRVNTIHPSGVDTPMFRQTWTKEKIEEIKKAVPMGRVAEVEDIAGAVTWLASDDAGFVNGAMIKVDGGVVSF